MFQFWFLHLLHKKVSRTLHRYISLFSPVIVPSDTTFTYEWVFVLLHTRGESTTWSYWIYFNKHQDVSLLCGCHLSLQLVIQSATGDYSQVHPGKEKRPTVVHGTIIQLVFQDGFVVKEMQDFECVCEIKYSSGKTKRKEGWESLSDSVCEHNYHSSCHWKSSSFIKNP